MSAGVAVQWQLKLSRGAAVQRKSAGVALQWQLKLSRGAAVQRMSAGVAVQWQLKLSRGAARVIVFNVFLKNICHVQASQQDQNKGSTAGAAHKTL